MEKIAPDSAGDASESHETLPSIMEEDEDRLDEGDKINDHMGGLNKLLIKMRDPKCGVEIKNRTWHARTYETCFIGSEAVDWMVRTLELPTREDAVGIGQSLMYRGIIQHVCNSEPFADHYFFYCFTEDIKQKKLAKKKIAARPDLLQKMQLDEAKVDELIKQMASPERGVEVKNRKYHLRTYENCFLGSEAVKWLFNQKVCPIRTTDEAVAIGQLLIDRGVFHHVTNSEPFKDGNYFYRFYKHENKYKKIESKSKDKDILALIQQGQEPELEDSLQWAEKMLKLLVKMDCIDKYGMLAHSKLNMIWTSMETRRENKLGLLRIFEKYLISYRFDAHQSLIPRVLKDDPPSAVNSIWKKTAKMDRVCREFVFKVPLPDHFFSEIIVCFLRFQVETIAIHYWQSGLFVITSTAKVMLKGSSKSVRFEGCGTQLERLLLIIQECVLSLVDPVKTGTPTIRCYITHDGKDSETASVPELCEAIFKNIQAFELGKGRVVEMKQIAPDLMMLDTQEGWNIKWSDLALQKVIGTGGFAKVHKAEWKGKSVAVKQFLDPTAFLEFRREVTLMSEISSHPNVVALVAICTSPPALVMQFCPCGDLRGAIKQRKAESWRVKLRIACDVASGLAYMHSRFPKIIHKDMKPQNVLLCDENPECAGPMAVVADFGTARYLVATVRVTEVENPVYLAPEVLRKQPFTERSDVYAFGYILWQLIVDIDAEPFDECRFAYQIEDAITAGRRPAINPQTRVPIAYAQLLKAVWDNDPLQRPMMASAVEILLDLRQAELTNSEAFAAAMDSYVNASATPMPQRKSSSNSTSVVAPLSMSASMILLAPESKKSVVQLSPTSEKPLSARKTSTPSPKPTKPSASRFSAARFRPPEDSASDNEESNAVQEIKTEKKDIELLLKKGNIPHSPSGYSDLESSSKMPPTLSASNSSASTSSTKLNPNGSTTGSSLSPPTALVPSATAVNISATFDRASTTASLPKTSARQESK